MPRTALKPPESCGKAAQLVVREDARLHVERIEQQILWAARQRQPIAMQLAAEEANPRLSTALEDERHETFAVVAVGARSRGDARASAARVTADRRGAALDALERALELRLELERERAHERRERRVGQLVAAEGSRPAKDARLHLTARLASREPLRRPAREVDRGRDRAEQPPDALTWVKVEEAECTQEMRLLYCPHRSCTWVR